MKPLGYWLKHIDNELEAAFDKVLVKEDLTRRQWQVLNTIASGARSVEEIDTAARPFLSPEMPTLRPVVESLAARGWVAECALTPSGQEAFDAISAKVHAFRRRTIEGLSDDEYGTLVSLLERVAANVTAAG
ncbi:MarR family transcriptional regulator [Actinocrispum sp. NPDC049592]|uniref:MarR family winged helix-turn-helix transcriptional regulator n=1 Tax=Actinocrispum sp. NPDC049592 TaxID=3154835 RepID=UPI00342F2FA4